MARSSMKSILLVDDDNTVLLGLGVRLKAMGYTILADAIECALSPGDNWQPALAV
jgi:hypothetical protein